MGDVGRDPRWEPVAGDVLETMYRQITVHIVTLAPPFVMFSTRIKFPGTGMSGLEKDWCVLKEWHHDMETAVVIKHGDHA